MTMDEVTVAQSRHYPVQITYNAEQFEPGNYYVATVEKSYLQQDRKYFYSAGLQQNARTIYHLPIDTISIAAGYEELLKNAVEQLQKKKHKAVIKDLLSRGETKTTVAKIVKDMIDEIRQEQKGNNSKKTVKQFIKPTPEELQTYINEKNLNVEADAFLDYYNSNGWKVGRNPMKDWKAALRNWSRKENAKPVHQNKIQSKPSYDIKEIERKAIYNDNYDI